MNWNTISREASKEYWKNTFLDVAFSEMKPCFIQKKRSHYESFGLILDVAIEHNEDKRAQPMSDRNIR